MSTKNSGKFLLGSIITFVIVFGLVSVLLSTMLSVANSVVKPESMAAEDVVARIAPVAQVHVGEAPAAAPAPVATPAPAATASTGGNGEKVVKASCAVCHGTGMMSSPKLGDAEGWAPRIEKGIDTLYANAINGLNMMPARGGNGALSDDEVKAAVDHMVSLAK